MRTILGLFEDPHLRTRCVRPVDPQKLEQFIEGYLQPRRDAAAQALERGVRSGEFRPDLDIDATIDALYGPEIGTMQAAVTHMSTPEWKLPMDLPDGLIDGMRRVRLPGASGIVIDTLVGGSGPPLLLLHGYPQTRLAWKAVVPHLLDAFTLVIPDMRGYGRSAVPFEACESTDFSKRQMGLDHFSVMAELGHERFAVVGHDRGARVAYRMALDQPQRVAQLAVIDIVPTPDVLENGPEAMLGLFHWTFLAQPYPLPETLLEGRTGEFVRLLLSRWAGKAFVFDEDSLSDYLCSLGNRSCLRATCEDYRASWSVDRIHDMSDRGNRKILQPTLVL